MKMPYEISKKEKKVQILTKKIKIFSFSGCFGGGGWDSRTFSLLMDELESNNKRYWLVVAYGVNFQRDVKEWEILK